MKLYLDDVRTTPDGWVRSYTVSETINLLKSNVVAELSLDHDLGDEVGVGTGYDVLKWIEEQVVVNHYQPPIIHIHTGNLSARVKMIAAVESIMKLAR